ncbi:MAG: ATP-NAD kinase [SAR202 cluster bacterium]|nr:ATP-NAD kinase [SAR202 cluster bacterium]
MTTIGIIANPMAGKDIRRLVAHGRYVSNNEKVNTLRRLFVGLDSVGVEQVLMMPDYDGISSNCKNYRSKNLKIETLDMRLIDNEMDSTNAAKILKELEVDCIITLGGDGTNRAVAKGCTTIPILPISTGTNNVFPENIEGTIAGIAAGLVSKNLVNINETTYKSNSLEVWIDNSFKDIALVDIAVSFTDSVGAKAIWTTSELSEIFVIKAKSTATGLSSIAYMLSGDELNKDKGIHIRANSTNSKNLKVPLAPGLIKSIPIKNWKYIKTDSRTKIAQSSCVLALDGERTLSVKSSSKVEIALKNNGPVVISTDKVIEQAALSNIMYNTAIADRI